MQKETKRIVSSIKKGGCPTFVSKVNVGSWKKFSLVVSEIAVENLNTIVTLGAVIETKPKQLYIAVITPSDAIVNGKDIVLCGVPDTVKKDSKETRYSVNEDEYSIEMLKLVYDENSDQSPFKLVDQVFGSITMYLKKTGVYQEEEEEYEYGFDDI